MWEHSPGAAASEQVQNGIDYLSPLVSERPSSPLGSRDKRPKTGPLCICEICGISFSLNWSTHVHQYTNLSISRHRLSDAKNLAPVVYSWDAHQAREILLESESSRRSE